MNVIEVGGVFGTPPYPESSEFNYYGDAGTPGSGTADLILRLSRPSAKEIEAVQGAPASPAEFALVEEGGVIFLLYRFGGGAGIPWSDCPYSWHLLPAERRVPPPPEGSAEQRQLLTTILLDCRSGVVKAMRQSSLSPEFTLALWSAIRRQIAAPFSAAAHDRAIAAAYRRWPNSEAMVRAAKARCYGGD